MVIIMEMGRLRRTENAAMKKIKEMTFQSAFHWLGS